MYRKAESIVNNNEDLDNYIEGLDIYNSALISILSDPGYSREDYIINLYEYRPDLIAEDYYGSVNYLGILLIQTKLGLEGFKKGTTLRLIPKKLIETIISKL